jgi:hypothetical protein
VIQHEGRPLGAVGPAALSSEQQLHAVVCDLQAITAASGTPRRTAADVVAGRAFPLTAAIGTGSIHAPTAIVRTVLMKALRGLPDLLTRCATFVRGRADQGVLRRTPSSYFRVFALLPLIFIALWWVTFYGRAFLSENVEARMNGAPARAIPAAVADRTKPTELTAAARAGAGTPRKAASKEANKSPAPKEAKAVAKTNPAPKQPAAKGEVTQDTMPEWLRQFFGN